MPRFRQFLPGKPGPEPFEWIAVTMILTLAFLTLLQAVGPRVQQVLDWVGNLLARLIA